MKPFTIFSFSFCIIYCSNFFVFYKTSALQLFKCLIFKYSFSSSDLFIIVFPSTFIIQRAWLATNSFLFIVTWIFSISKDICSQYFASRSFLKINLLKFCSLYTEAPLVMIFEKFVLKQL